MSRQPVMSDLNAEKAVLGALLRSEHQFWSISDTLQADMFSKPIHREIFGAIRDLLLGGKKLSIAVLSTHLPPEDDEQRDMPALLAALAHNADGLSAADFADTVAEAAARRRLLQIADTIAKAARSGEKTAIDIAADGETGLLDVMHISAPKRPRRLYDLAVSVMRSSNRAQAGVSLPGFDTGLPSIDEILGLIMPGDLGAIIGAQGDGKSALAAGFLRRATMRAPGLMFQLEMTDEQIAARELAAEADMSVRELHEGEYTFDGVERLKRATEALAAPELWILDEPKMTVRQMRAHALAMKRTRGLGMVVVDHLRLVRGDGKTRDRWERQAEVTGDLKILAKELEVPVVLLAQRTRSAQRRDDPTPMVDDADAPSLDQDCDWILGVWRKESWLRRNKPSVKASGEEKANWDREVEKWKGKGEVITLKRRRGAAFEQRQLRWVGSKTRFEEL
jgi:replicative DNA helicase